MKKVFTFLLVLIVVALGAIYLFIPARLVVAREVLVRANSVGVYRTVANEKSWAKWWPGSMGANINSSFLYNGYQFDVSNKIFKSVEVLIKNNEQEYSSAILFIPITRDSSLIRWEVPIENGNNPIKRLTNYFQARKIANTISNPLQSMKAFMETEENIYGLSVKQSMVVDTAFISTRTIFNHFPSTEEVYAMIDKLHSHVAKQNGKENGYPMLNIDSSGGVKEYEVMVAIATDRILPEAGDIKLKRMIQGNILVAQVTGGPFIVSNGLSQLNEYVRDHQKTPAAIPFQLLVTDRLKEKDTTKWVTELRYPVF